MNFARNALVGLTLLTSLLTSGCLGPHFQEEYDSAGFVYKDAEHNLTIFEHTKGKIYWIPLADTTRTSFTSNEIEIKHLHPVSGPEVRIKCDLQKHPRATEHQVANFIGATESYGFWAYEGGYFVVDLNTAKITFVDCNRNYVMSGDWTRISATAIRRKTRDGVFDLSIDGAKEVERTITPEGMAVPNTTAEPESPAIAH